MPRTKRPVKKTKNSIEGSESKAEILKKLDKFVADEKKKIDMRCQLEVRNIEMQFKILLDTLNPKYLTMTVGQLKNELYLKEVSRRSRNTARSASDDGYITENSSQGSAGQLYKKQVGPPPSSASRSRRSRSVEAPRAAPARRTTQRRASRSVYRTPAAHRLAAHEYAPITPKVAPETPLTVLRQPRQGEMVVSMQGSPVMVPTFNTMQHNEEANCNILLTDGTMLSLKPHELRQSTAYIPVSLMAPRVWEQIRTLKENLDKVMKIGEKSLK